MSQLAKGERRSRYWEPMMVKVFGLGKHAQMGCRLGGVFILFVFGAGALAPYFWFSIAEAERKQEQLVLEVPGFGRTTESPAGSVAEALRTTNLMQIVYHPFTGAEKCITAFIASWQPKQGSAFLAFGHTPDICWVGAGWRPLEYPSSIQVAVGGLEFPFECRLFEFGNAGRRELVIWTYLIDGKPTPALGFFQTAREASFGDIALGISSRFMRAKQLSELISDRRTLIGSKSYWRFSTDASEDSEAARERLVEFTERWLQQNIEAAR